MGRVRSSVRRSRLPLHRRPFADPAALRRWLLVAALALAAAAVTGSVLTRAESARRRWGTTRPVLVVERELAAGDALADAVTEARWPTALVPAGAVARLPADAVAAGPLAPGSAVAAALVADPGDPLAADRRRVALPVGVARLPVEVGDRVDVWATVDPSISGAELATSRVAVGAVVTEAGTDAVVVAVDPDEVAAVAEAAALATVTVVGSG